MSPLNESQSVQSAYFTSLPKLADRHLSAERDLQPASIGQKPMVSSMSQK